MTLFNTYYKATVIKCIKSVKWDKNNLFKKRSWSWDNWISMCKDKVYSKGPIDIKVRAKTIKILEKKKSNISF